VRILALAGAPAGQLSALAAEAGEGGAGLTINLFWIIVSALNFLVFFFLVYRIVLVPVRGMLEDRRARIEQGLRDADAARRDREAAADQREAVLAEARREAGEIVARAQRMADEAREQGVADTQAEIERRKARAAADIEAERQRAMADVRTQVADLALLAAGKVVGETMDGPRERRLVEEFLVQVSAPAPAAGEPR
jgi:F-type H+-transporting ATPase subunit b